MHRMAPVIASVCDYDEAMPLRQIRRGRVHQGAALSSRCCEAHRMAPVIASVLMHRMASVIASVLMHRMASVIASV